MKNSPFSILHFQLALLVAAVLLTSCRKDEIEMPQITMVTSQSGNVWLSLAGSGEVTIDWGDGTPSETHTLNSGSDWSNWPGFYSRYRYGHRYSSATSRTLTITGYNITHFYCYLIQLTSLDVSKNPALTHLYCAGNELTSLDLKNNRALTYLHCASNQLVNLDVSKNTLLTILYCFNNQLTGLDVGENIELTYLDCCMNQLANLDESKNT